MSGGRSRFTLPLLTKELIELSARRKLFVIRVLYALLLFTVAGLWILPIFQQGNFNYFSILGVGQQVFTMLIYTQFIGIYLFLPAITCGAISVEKERNTLALLFLTKLSPGTIIFEKLVSRWVQMLSLLFISLPTLAFSYSLGGIEMFDLFCGVWFLLLATIEVSSIAILASTYYRTTTAAFLASYLFVLLSNVFFIFSPPILAYHFFSWPDRLRNSVQGYLACVIAGLMPLGISMICIFTARSQLITRAFLPPINPLLIFFKALDAIFTEANQRYTRGIVLVKEAATLPDQQPVAWREKTKRALGQFRYLARILLVLEAPTVTFLLAVAQGGGRGDTGPQAVGLYLLAIWIIVTLLVTISSATLITNERSRQTLDVLLTSALPSREIILQKMAGMQRLIGICAIPLVTCILFQAWWRQEWYINRDSEQRVLEYTSGFRTEYYFWHEYLIGGLLTTFIYMKLLTWLSLWMGIRTASPSRAIMMSLLTVVAWCAVPLVALNALDINSLKPDRQANALTFCVMCLSLLSPAMFLGVSELSSVIDLHPMPYLAVIVNSGIYLSCWLLIRRHVLNNADYYLGRTSVLRSNAAPAESVAPMPALIHS